MLESAKENYHIIPTEVKDNIDIRKLGFIINEYYAIGYINVDYPDGWKRIKTEENDKYEIHDDKNRCRVIIDYGEQPKIFICNRYKYIISTIYKDGKKDKIFSQIKKAGQGIIWTSPKIIYNSNTERVVKQKAKNMAINQLSNLYPEWKNPLMYWDNIQFVEEEKIPHIIILDE